LAAEHLAPLVESGDAAQIRRYLEELLAPFAGKVSAVVLGCTHYVFCRRMIGEIMGEIPVVDGNEGTVTNLKRILTEKGMLNSAGGERLFLASDADKIETKYKALFYRMPF
jgi:glutamate racemase